MRFRILTLFFAFVLFLVGCQTNTPNDGNDRDEGAIQQTRFNEDQGTRDQGTRDDLQDRNRTNDTELDGDGSNVLPRTGPHTDNGQTNDRNDNRFNVSKRAADKITKQIDEIDQAYVVTTENNAYVAVAYDGDNQTDRNNGQLDRDDQTENNNDRSDNNDQTNRNQDEDVTEEVKSEISDIVQSVDQDIDNVYVSTNPDFLDLANNYMNDFNEGRPIRGLFDQMGEMIERVFPQDRR